MFIYIYLAYTVIFPNFIFLMYIGLINYGQPALIILIFSLFLAYKERIHNAISWSKLRPNCSPFVVITLLESENISEKYRSFLSEVGRTKNIVIFKLYCSH